MTFMTRGQRIIVLLVLAGVAVAATGDVGPPDPSWGPDRLASLVKSSDTAVAAEAAKALGELRDSAVALQALCDVAGDDGADDAVRLAAVSALRDFGDPAAAGGLIGALGEGPVSAAAAEALRNYKSPTTTASVVLVLKGDKKPARRAAAAHALGRIGDPAAGPECILALEDKSPRVREAACSAAVALAPPDAVEPLIRALSTDKEWRVRLAAARALGQTKDGRAVTPLTRRLEDKSPEVRAAAAAALALIGDVRALDPLRNLVKEERDPAAKAAMEKALADIKTAVLTEVKPK